MHKYLHMAACHAAKGHPGRRAFVGAIGIRDDGTIVKSHNGRADVTRCGGLMDVGTVIATRNHAEARLVRKAGHGSTVFVGRVRRDTGAMVLARPCKNCYNILKNHGVKKCYYTISDHEYGVIEF